ncbi:hypothetical protein DPMN_162936 [Dreissena polymorpha]|uniref:Reverse transcriptase domain-containing protein n=1 Tax=Dreissena polymorpha TaxID=45954 RepID=A0A9D4ITZ7_DREPO|nr:hypothetical protein DPMN_162936 [Dreissena polymorpha]
MILLDRCKNNILNKLNRLQGGFQDQLGCILTSFALRECLHYARENSSSVFLCYLDARQAFDRVWHEGLFHKLLALNNDPLAPLVDNNTLAAFRDMYRNTKSRVRYQGLHSCTPRYSTGR